MNLTEFIESGIIETYCLGAATEAEKLQVEKLASQHKEIQDEIASIYEALYNYSMAHGKTPSPSVKQKVMEAIMNAADPEFPPRLTLHSKPEEWHQYIAKNNIAAPEYDGNLCVLDLPSDERQTTYIVWARKGAVVEESHATEDEYLLMLKGYCSVAIDGVVGYYKAGDIAYIPKNAVHRAEVLSDEEMLIIGQRVAA